MDLNPYQSPKAAEKRPFPHYRPYLVALVASALLIGAMYLFRLQMIERMRAWETADVSLAGWQVALSHAAAFVVRYHYALAAFVFLASFGMARLVVASRLGFQARRPAA